MLHILTQYKTVRDRLFIETPAIPSTFWNPIDHFGGTLLNDNYTVDISDAGPGNGNTHFNSGLENCILFDSGLWYWEVIIETLTSGGVNPHLSFGLRQSMDGLSPKNSILGAKLMYSPGPTTIPNVAFWSDTGAGALVGESGSHLTVTTTGTSGFATGDILMFAYNATSGRLWLGKNGTWFNSGDPAAGTGQQFSGFDTALQGGPFSWRFFYEANFVTAEPQRFNGAFGNNTFPQEYAAPAGFTALLPPSSADYFAAWNPGNSSCCSSTTVQFTGASMALGNWQTNGSLFIGNPSMSAYSAGRLWDTGKYYWEATVNIGVTGVYVGIVNLLEAISFSIGAGTQCIWKNDGVLSDGDASITMHTTGVVGFTTSNRLKFAFDGPAGKLWIGTVAAGFFDSGDPAAGTNPQFSSIPTGITWQFIWTIDGGTRSCTLHPPADFTGATPTGFKKGIPLAVSAT